MKHVRYKLISALLLFSMYFQFEVPETIERDDVMKNHRSDGYSFANNFVHSLCTLQSILRQYERYIA